MSETGILDIGHYKCIGTNSKTPGQAPSRRDARRTITREVMSRLAPQVLYT